jgi:predicted amino acid racemase
MKLPHYRVTWIPNDAVAEYERKHGTDWDCAHMFAECERARNFQTEASAARFAAEVAADTHIGCANVHRVDLSAIDELAALGDTDDTLLYDVEPQTTTTGSK